MQRHRRRGSLRSSRRAGAWIAALLAAAACDGRIDSEAEPGPVTGESGTSAPGGDSSTPERDDAGPSGTPDAGHGSDAATDSGTDASGSSDANTGPADGGAPDAASDGDAGSQSDAGAQPAGTVPILVALSDGGWSMASCDHGLNWHVNPELSPEREDHSEWTAFGGLAFGGGTFVGALGWGFPGHMIASSDGVAWQEVDDSQFRRDDQPLGLHDSLSGVVFIRDQFVAFSRHVWRSGDGRSWSAQDPTWPAGTHQVRQVRAFPEDDLVVAAVETQYGTDHALGHFVLVSDDGGGTWVEGQGYSPACGNPIQHWGDIAMRAGVLVLGTRDVCRSADRGRTWQTVPAPAAADLGDIFVDASAFYAVAGDRLLRSPDGIDWQPHGMLPARCDRGVHADGHFVVMDAGAQHVYHSDDGVNWQDVTPAGASAAAPRIRDLVAGYGQPNAACPN